jgi:hypothetical protein
MTMTRISSDAVVLPRGGVVFPTRIGGIQYGAVPETVKDTMATGVPTIFILPHRFYALNRGILWAELEFPVFWNFYVCKTRTTIICRPSQRKTLMHVLSEASFGPFFLDSTEFQRGGDDLPNLQAEMHFFQFDAAKGRRTELADMVDIKVFDDEGRVMLRDGVEVRLESHHDIVIVERGRERHRCHGDPPLPAAHTSKHEKRRHFKRPHLGVTVIGSGHGFDPTNRTSGFLIWIDGRGVLVDPPVDALDWLAGYDIDPREIDSLILTHCHADHDAGTLQKILQDERITIFTTRTVMSSFVHKYARLSNMPPHAFRQLFDFVPVMHNQPLSLHGAEVTFRYSFHSIPCVGFEMTHRGRSLMYPSDTLNDPNIIRRLRDDGLISQQRAHELVDMPERHELILHEAGVPPIHTPVKTLVGLDDAIKDKLYLVHVSAGSLPAGSGLRVAPTGLENTIDLGAPAGAPDDLIQALDALSHTDILRDLPARRVADFVLSTRKIRFEPGEHLYRSGSPAEHFYIILSGEAWSYRGERKLRSYGAFDHLGEGAIISQRPRRFDVIASTEVLALAVKAADFMRLLHGTAQLAEFTQLTRLRTLPTWEFLESSDLFRHFSSKQKNSLQVLMVPCLIEAGSMIEGDPVLIERGHVEAVRNGEVLRVLPHGGLAADVHAIVERLPATVRFQALDEVQGYRLRLAAFRQFLRQYPGVTMRLTAWWRQLLHGHAAPSHTIHETNQDVPAPIA